jgi:hypothetical protein
MDSYQVASEQKFNGLNAQWRERLRLWAVDGSIANAAQRALRLRAVPGPLSALMSQWSSGDFGALPPIRLLSSEAISGALGAYSVSAGTIVLNAEWLQVATSDQVSAVLTEELGHHLDALLNASDTTGDEGELFAALLHGTGWVSSLEQDRMLMDNDHGSVLMDGVLLQVEQATLNSTPIRVASPGRTRSEFMNQLAFAALVSDGSVVAWGNPSTGGEYLCGRWAAPLGRCSDLLDVRCACCPQSGWLRRHLG